MAYDTLLVGDSGNVRVVTLNRPDVMNALNGTMKDELVDALKQAERDGTVRCLVITGSGRAFCSGQDLTEFALPETRSVAEALRRTYNVIVTRIRSMEKPVVAAVNGAAAGAGCSLALACDLRVAAETASFVAAFVRVGLIPDSGATYTLPRIVGLGKALEMAFTGEPIDARTALHLGLVNQVVPGDQLSQAAMALATKLAQGPTRAIGLTKRAMNRGLTTDLEAALEYEARIQEIAVRTNDYQEGVRAFLEKRRPDFTGS